MERCVAGWWDDLDVVAEGSVPFNVEMLGPTFRLTEALLLKDLIRSREYRGWDRKTESFEQS
jgi:hypothetical protein